MLDCKVAEGRLSDVIQSSLGYTLTYYHTMDGNMYKEWMNEKRTKKDFRIQNDDDNERRIWVYLPDEKNEEEVEPLNLMINEFTNSCPKPWSTDISRSYRSMWSIWIGITTNSSTIHKSTIRNVSTGSRVCRLRVSHWWEDQTQALHVVLLGCVSYPHNSDSTTSIPYTTWGRERSSSFHGLFDSITRECEETPVQWDVVGSDTEGRERLSVYICVSILSQETGEWQGKTSCICGRRILEWCWGEALRGWTIHMYLLQEVQSTTLIQQGELQIASVFPQWIS